MNRNCSVCNIKIDTTKYKKDRTACKNCYNRNKNKRKDNDKNTLLQNQLPKFENVNNNKNNSNNPSVLTCENDSHIVIGPRNVGETYYMMKVLEKKVTKIYSYNNQIIQSTSKL